MKYPKLGDIFTWKGAFAKIIWTTEEPTVGIEMFEHKKCPHCGGDLGKEQFSMIPTCPLFQECAEPIKTIEEQ